MSVRSEQWSPTTAPSLRDSSLGASGLPVSSLPETSLVPLPVAAPKGTAARALALLWARLRAISLHHAVSERHGGLVVAGMLAATGAFFLWQSLFLDLGNLDLPGPGFFPLCLGLGIVLGSIVIGVEQWRSSDRESVELGHRDVLVAMAALLIVPLIFEPLGAYLTLGLFGTMLLVLIARVPLLLALAATAAGLVACWYFFQVLLGLQLPHGPFEMGPF
jgi:hypothetical protein